MIKTKIITVKVTENQSQKLAERAKNLELTRSAYIRHALFQIIKE